MGALSVKFFFHSCNQVNGQSVIISTDLYLFAGEVIDIRIQHNHGADRNLNAGKSTDVTIFKMGE